MYISKTNYITKIKINKIRGLIEAIKAADDYEDNLNLYKYIFKREFDKILNRTNCIPEYSFINEKLCLYEDVYNTFNELYLKHSEIEGYLTEFNNVLTTINNAYYTNILNIFNSTASLKMKCNTSSIDQYTIIDNFDKIGNVQSENINSTKNHIELLSTENPIDLSVAYVEVLDGSNGFPGNTHVAYLENANIVFDGEKDLKINLNNIFSSDSDFEYELIKLSKENYANAKGYGYSYDEGVPYVTLKNDPLELTLKITLPYEMSLNAISFNDNQGDSRYLINEISVYSKNFTNSKIVATNMFSNKYNYFSFSEQLTNEIIIKITQSKAYQCKIGHYYNLVDNYSNYYYSVSNSETHIGSITNLGIGYNDGTLFNPKNYITKNQFITVDENAVKNNLFNLDYQLELIDAERLSVSLNNFKLNLNKYSSKGSIIKTYSFDYEISKITFNATEYIPSKLNANNIEYYISFNKINWIKITPSYRCDFNDIGTIKINSTEFLNANNTLFLNLLENPKEFDLKIVLSTTNNNYSPIISSIEIKTEE